MNVFTACGQATARLLRWIWPIRRPVQEMADQRWGKQSKLETLQAAIDTRDIQELGEADRDAVAQFRADKMKWNQPPAGAGGDRDNVVCDDMTINTGRGSLPEALIVALLGCLAFWWLTGGGRPPAPASPQPASPQPRGAVTVDAVDSQYEILFYDRDGRPISVPHISARNAATAPTTDHAPAGKGAP